MTTTIILTVSRDDFLSEVISSLELLDCDQSYTNILCVVDGDSKLFTKVRNLIQDTKFNQRLTVQYPDRTPVKKFDVMFRRKRITAIHNYAKSLVDVCDFVLLTEDDTIVPSDALKKLIRTAINQPGCASVEGVEIGRWGIPYVGAWRFDDIYNPESVTSLPYRNSGIEPIDGFGFYCILMRADVYKNHNFILYESLGPDISMGLELRRQGFMNFIDWSVTCKHLNMNKNTKEILVPDSNVEQVTLVRKNSSNWQQKP